MKIDELKKNSEEVADILKTIGHPKRLMILCFLCQAEHTVNELELLCEISQSQLSQFLKRMELEGLISSRKEGKFVKYKIENFKVAALINSLYGIFCGKKAK